MINCYYNRVGINPNYYASEILLLKTMLPQLVEIISDTGESVTKWLKTVNGSKHLPS